MYNNFITNPNGKESLDSVSFHTIIVYHENAENSLPHSTPPYNNLKKI